LLLGQGTKVERREKTKSGKYAGHFRSHMDERENTASQ
jgi:hypothetical protein